MSIQNAHAVAITGGTIANIASSGTFIHQGNSFNITRTAGAGPSLQVTGPGDGSYAIRADDAKFGGLFQAGAVRGDVSLLVRNQAGTIQGLVVYGDQVVACAHRLVIPVGADKWAQDGKSSGLSLDRRKYISICF
jgi:hypothetical protein